MIEFCHKLLNSRIFYPLIVLIVMLGFYFFNIDQTFIEIYDETSYLMNGIYSAVNPTFGPIYSKFYWLLSFFSSDKLLLYDTARILVTSFFFPISVYLLLMNSGLPRVAVLMMSILLSISYGALRASYVHDFNFAFIILTFFLFYQKKSRIFQVICLVIWGGSVFLRQDNVVVFTFFYIFLIFFNWRIWSFKDRVFNFFSPVFFIIGFYFFYSNWGSPWGARVFLAFKDHFIWRQRENITSFEQFEVKFSKAKGIFDFLYHYPESLTKHFFKNLVELPNSLFMSVSLKGYYSNLFLFRESLTIFSWFFLFLTIFCLFNNFSSILKMKNQLVALLIGIFLQNFLMAILLSPLVKYLTGLKVITLGVLIPFLIFKMCSVKKYPSIIKPYLQKVSIVIFILCIIFHFFSKDVSFFSPFPEDSNLINPRLLIKEIKREKIFKWDDNILTWGPIGFYTHPDENSVSKHGNILSYFFSFDGSSDFATYMISNKINIFCFESYLKSRPDGYFKGAKELDYFLSNLSKYGYMETNDKLYNSRISCVRRDHFLN